MFLNIANAAQFHYLVRPLVSIYNFPLNGTIVSWVSLKHLHGRTVLKVKNKSSSSVMCITQSQENVAVALDTPVMCSNSFITIFFSIRDLSQLDK